MRVARPVKYKINETIKSAINIKKIILATPAAAKQIRVKPKRAAKTEITKNMTVQTNI
jgi:hypothetical protein